MTDIPHVGVVTVTYGSEANLADFFQSVRTQQGVRISLYIVDNASPDNSLRLSEEEVFPAHVSKVIIENGANLGVAAGNNRGITAALEDGVDWVLLLNNDTAFPPDFIRTLAEVGERDGRRLLAPVIATNDETNSLWYGGGRVVPWQGFRVVHDGMYSRPASTISFERSSVRTGYASTCCLLVAPSVFSQVGLMDESYFVYSDDTDFSIRCTQAGVPTFVTAKTLMLHKDGGSTGGNLSRFSVWWLTRNWVLVARRHLPKWRQPVAFAYLFVWMFGRLALRRETWRHTSLRLRAIRAAIRIDLSDHSVPVDLAIG